MYLHKNLSNLGLSLALGAMVLGGSDLAAQSRRAGRASKVASRTKIDTQALRDSLELQYKDYRLAEARKSYELLRRTLDTDTIPTLSHRGEQLERAERLLSRVEHIKLLASEECSWEDLNNLFATYSLPNLAKQLRFTLNEQGDYTMEQVVSIDGYRWRLTAEGSPRNLIRKERITNTEEALSLGNSINTQGANEAFGFILSDGIRLVFASDKKEDGLGGYDLYFSRYNLERKAYLEPTHVPMPFNSPSNDYLLVCDEEGNRTYLVSDRDATPGKVRLFVFEGLPRFITGLNSEDVAYSEANADAIALARLAQAPSIRTLTPIEKEAEREQCFLPLNGDVVIRQWAEFSSAEAMEMYRLYLANEKKLQDLERTRLDQKEVQKLREQQSKRLIEVKNIEIKNRQKQ